MFYNAWCHGSSHRHGRNIYDKRDVFYITRRHGRDDPSGRNVLRDSGRDREDDYDERDVFYDVRRRGRHFFSSPYMLWDGHI